jgi:hypothetical protein
MNRRERDKGKRSPALARPQSTVSKGVKQFYQTRNTHRGASDIIVVHIRRSYFLEVKQVGESVQYCSDATRDPV